MKISEKLIAGIGGLVLAVAATFSGVAIANPAAPVDDSPAKIVQEQPKTVDLEPEVTPEPTQEPVAPAPAPEPVVEAPAPPPPPAPAPPAPGASGSVVPWIPSPDPVNAPDAGYWDTTQCNSGSASTGADGKAYCD